MLTRVQKWGNSQGLRLNKKLLADININVGDAVEIATRDGVIIITPARRVRGGHDLRQLVRDIPANYKAEELDWGPAAGREVW
jgi:antitoxin MazE